jgi:hypothetical protein
MSFPDTDLDVVFDVYLGADPTADPGTWPAPTDLSSRVLRRPISIRRGRQKNQKTAQAGSCTFWLDNTDGALTPLLATSPYYGTWDLGVPVKFSVDNVGSSPPYVRHTGFVAAIDMVMIPGTDGNNISAVRVVSSGVLRRLTQGAVAKSALFRTITGQNSPAPVAYWPLESEGRLASLLSSWVDPAMNATVTPDLEPGGTDGPVGSAGALSYTTDFSVGTTDALFRVSPYSSSGTTIITAHVRHPLADAPADTVQVYGTFGWDVSGDLDYSQVVVDEKFDWYGGTGFEATEARFLSGIGNIMTAAVDIGDGEWHELQVRITQDGSDIDYEFWVDGTQHDTMTRSSLTYGNVELLRSFGGLNLDGSGMVLDTSATVELCHLSVHTDDGAGQFYDAMQAYVGEEAHTRFLRVCAEEGIVVASSATESVQVGPQPVADVVAVLQDAEAVDHGMLVEGLATWGLEYIALSQRYNRDAELTVDLSTYRTTAGTQADVLTPIRDDARIRNEWTISRVDGSSSTYRDEANIAKRGRYDDDATVNVYDDAAAADEARWRVHEGTFDGLRYASVPLDLGANVALLSDWLDLDLTARIDRTNALAEHPTDPATLVIEGYAELIRHRGWEAALNAEPFDTYKIFELAEDSADAGEFVGRLDVDTLTLVDAIDDDDTSLVVSSIPPLTTDADDFDPDIALRVGGEVVDLSAVSDYGSDTFARSTSPTATDAFGRSVSNGWGSADTSQAWTTGGGAATDYNVAAGKGTHSAGVVNSTRRTTLAVSVFEQDTTATISVPVVATGAQISTGLMLAYVDSTNYYQADILWQTGGTLAIRVVSRVGGVGTTLASASVGSYSAGQTWHIRAAIAAGQIHARAWLDGDTEPTSWQVTGAATTLTSAGPVGFRTNLDTSNTNALPVVVSYDDVSITTLAQSWGTASSGLTWAEVGGTAANYAVLDGKGLHGLSTVNASRRTILGLDVADSDITVTVTTPVVALTADIHVAIMTRYQDGSNYYMLEPQFEPSGVFTVTIYKQVGGVFTALVIQDPFQPKPTYAAGDSIKMRFRTVGTTLLGRVWAASADEPNIWHAEATATGFDTGDIGLRSNLSLGNTNTLPVVITYDDFVMNSPQTFTVTRSVNGVVKSHAAGSAVEVENALVLGL